MSTLAETLGLGDKPKPGEPKESSYNTGIRDFGNVLDLLASVSGAVGFASLIIGLFSSGDNAVQALSEQIQKVYDNLSILIDVSSDKATLMELSTQMSNARAVFNTITTTPPPYDSPQLQFETCRAAVEALTNDPWTVPFLESNYWTDAEKNFIFLKGIHLPGGDRGYGAQLPDHGRSAFNYLNLLPTYLEALTIYITVGTILFPKDFTSRYGEDLKKKTDFLEQQYSQIMRGITPLAPAAWTRDSLLNALTRMFLDVNTGVMPLSKDPRALDGSIAFELNPDYTVSPVGMGILGGVDLEYGAVEKFSGFSSMGDYNISLDQINAMSSDSSAYNKFQIRLWKTMMDVYLGLSLLDAWQSINGLRALVGNAPLPRPTFGGVPIADWSFRYLMSTAKIRARGGLTETPVSTLHLRDLAKFIESTPPKDTSPSTAWISFRSLLTPNG